MTYHRPATLPQALDLLAREAPQVIAGGTDVFPAMRGRALRGARLDLTGLAELRGITETDKGWRIGAATTWADMAGTDLPPAFRALQQAALKVGAVQIQNAGTIGGNLCNASPAADGVPPLLVLDAQVVLTSTRGERQMPVQDFLQGPRQTALQAGELLTAVTVPKTSMQGLSQFEKLGARAHLVISICMVAVRVRVVDGRMSDVAIAVGAASPVARRLPGLEAALQGEMTPDPSRIAAHVRAGLSPIDDIRAGAGYRLSAVSELILRALTGCLG